MASYAPKQGAGVEVRWHPTTGGTLRRTAGTLSVRPEDPSFESPRRKAQAARPSRGLSGDLVALAFTRRPKAVGRVDPFAVLEQDLKHSVESAAAAAGGPERYSDRVTAWLSQRRLKRLALGQPSNLGWLDMRSTKIRRSVP
jgi:hypothetical protein